MMKKKKIFISIVRKNKLINMYEITVFYKLVVIALSFLNSILINRSLGVQLRGEYTTIVNWASLMQLFLTLGIGSAYPAIKRRYPEKSKAIFSTIVLIIAGIYAVVFLCTNIFLNIDAKYTCIIAYTSTIESLLIFIALVENVTQKNRINIITAAIHTAFLWFIFLFFKHNLYAILWSVIIDHIILSLGLIIYNQLWNISFTMLNRKLLVEIFQIAIPSMLMNMLMYLNYHADILFLSAITEDAYIVGLYGTAVTLGNMLWIIPDAFKDILFNRAAKKDNPQEIMVAIFVNIILCLVVLIGFIIFGKWFLGVMYGKEFIAAYPLVLLLFTGTFPMALYKLIHPIYITNGKTGIVVLLLLVAVLVNCIGNMILIPIYSGVGAAIASIISYMICGIIFFIKFQYDYKVSISVAIKNIKKLTK